MQISLLPNALKIGHEQHVRSSVSFHFFFPSPWSSSSARMATETTTETQQAQSKKKKKTQLSREDHVSSKVGFLKFCYLLFLANNYETVILNIEIFFCKTVLLPLLVELELELEFETKSTFGAETKTNIWDLEQHLTWVLEFWRCIALMHWLHCSRGMHFFSSFFSFLLVVYII